LVTQAIVFPDWIVFRAVIQWNEARLLQKQLNTFGVPLMASSSSHGAAADLPHELGYFAVMGGFQVRVKEDHWKVLDSFWGRTLTPRGVLLLGRLKLLPALDKDAIKDRSKAGSFCKSLGMHPSDVDADSSYRAKSLGATRHTARTEYLSSCSYRWDHVCDLVEEATRYQ
jgi:hypothetical protein